MKAISEKKMKGAITDFLINFSCFKKLDNEELNVVGEHINFYEMEPDEVLFNEGDEGDTVYFIIDGELDVIKETVSGVKVGIDRVVISTLTKGRSIGEMAVIDKIPRSATVKSKTDVILSSLTLDGFDLLLDKHPSVGIKILKGIARLLSMNLRKTSSRLADYMLPVS